MCVCICAHFLSVSGGLARAEGLEGAHTKHNYGTINQYQRRSQRKGADVRYLAQRERDMCVWELYQDTTYTIVYSTLRIIRVYLYTCILICGLLFLFGPSAGCAKEVFVRRAILINHLQPQNARRINATSLRRVL